MSPLQKQILDAAYTSEFIQLNREEVGEFVFLLPDMTWLKRFEVCCDAVPALKTNGRYPFLHGIVGGNRVTAICSHIGVDNIDFIINYVDAVVNLDFTPSDAQIKAEQLFFIQLGAAHSIQDKIETGSIVANTLAIGFDNLLHFYDPELSLSELTLAQEMMEFLETRTEMLIFPYAAAADTEAIKQLTDTFSRQITISVPGFFAPMGRKLRLKPAEDKLTDLLQKFRFEGKAIATYSQDTAAFHGLCKALNNKALSFSGVFSNLIHGTQETAPGKLIDHVITSVSAEICKAR